MPNIMKTYQLVQRKTISSNTSEHGFGDYPETKWEEIDLLIVDDEKTAKTAFKKKYKGIKFSCKFPSFLVWEKK